MPSHEFLRNVQNWLIEMNIFDHEFSDQVFTILRLVLIGTVYLLIGLAAKSTIDSEDLQSALSKPAMKNLVLLTIGIISIDWITGLIIGN